MRRTTARLLASILLLPLALVAGAPAPAVARPADPAAARTVGQTAAPHPAVLAERRVGEHLVDLTVQSAALDGPATVRLLTPRGWHERDADDRWPVLYLLHGMFGDHADWTTQTDVEELAALRDVLVVMPDGGDPGGYYSNWWNGGRYGAPAWETFHLDELRPLLEGGYGAGTRRVVAGASMGGFGALVYAARRPAMFRAVASYSGPVHLLHPESVAAWQFAFEEEPVYRDLWGDPVAQRPNWERHDPYHLAGRLRHVPVFLSCGDGTWGPLDGPATTPFDEQTEAFDRVLNESLAVELRRQRIPLVTDFYPGTHQPAYWERELHRSLPMLLAALR